MKYNLVIDKDAEESIVVTAHSESELTEKIESLVLSYTGRDRISVYSDDELLELSSSEIECVTVIDRKVFVIDGKGKMYRTAQRLSTLEQMLPSSFIRINKSTIANERRILRLRYLCAVPWEAIALQVGRETSAVYTAYRKALNKAALATPLPQVS